MTPPTSLPPSAARARRFSTGGSAAEPARSKESSARVSAVLTDCPPGPGDLENRQVNSSGGIVTPRTVTSRLIVLAAPPMLPDPAFIVSGLLHQAGSGPRRLRAYYSGLVRAGPGTSGDRRRELPRGGASGRTHRPPYCRRGHRRGRGARRGIPVSQRHWWCGISFSRDA